MQPLVIRIDPEVKAALDKMAAERGGASIASLVRVFIKEGLVRYGQVAQTKSTKSKPGSDCQAAA